MSGYTDSCELSTTGIGIPRQGAKKQDEVNGGEESSLDNTSLLSQRVNFDL